MPSNGDSREGRSSKHHRRSRSSSKSRSRSRSVQRKRRSRSGTYSRSPSPSICKRLHIANLDDSVRRRDIEDVYGKFGKLTDVWVASYPPFYAFVVFEKGEEAQDALKDMRSGYIRDCHIRTTVALPRQNSRRPPPRGRGFGGGGGGGYGSRRSRSRSPRKSSRRSRSRSPMKKHRRSRSRSSSR